MPGHSDNTRIATVVVDPSVIQTSTIPLLRAPPRVPTEQLGIEIINELEANNTVDIVAVPGLSVTPEKAWKHWETKTDWLKDILIKDLPYARIARFGYDSQRIGKDPVQVEPGEVAAKLLAAVNDCRRHCQDRPVLFIAHSWGGLVVEKALMYCHLGSRSDPHSRQLLKATVGVIFFGTPHSGMVTFTEDGQSMLAYKNFVIENPEISQDNLAIRSLEALGGRRLDIAKDFLRLCDNEAGSHLKILNVYETRKSNVGKHIGVDIQELMVTEASATFDTYPSLALPLDHYGLNKFQGPDDGNYKEILIRIQNMLNKEVVWRSSAPLFVLPNQNTAQLSSIIPLGRILTNVLTPYQDVLDPPQEIQGRKHNYENYVYQGLQKTAVGPSNSDHNGNEFVAVQAKSATYRFVPSSCDALRAHLSAPTASKIDSVSNQEEEEEEDKGKAWFSRHWSPGRKFYMVVAALTTCDAQVIVKKNVANEAECIADTASVEERATTPISMTAISQAIRIHAEAGGRATATSTTSFKVDDERDIAISCRKINFTKTPLSKANPTLSDEDGTSWIWIVDPTRRGNPKLPPTTEDNFMSLMFDDLVDKRDMDANNDRRWADDSEDDEPLLQRQLIDGVELIY